MTWPTFTTDFTGVKISLITPDTSLGISESTLSVATSTKISSTLMVSPTFLSQEETIASSTLSPIWGNFSSYLAIFLIVIGYWLVVSC